MNFLLTILLPLFISLSHSATTSDWELVNEDDGVKSFKKKFEDSRTVAFRGEGIVEASPIRILTILSDTERNKEWNKNLKKILLLEKKGINDRVQYLETKVPFPYKNREVVVRIKTNWDEKLGAIFIDSESVEDERAPKDTGCVRAKVVFARYILKPIKNWKATEMTIEINADPMGNIPAWLVNLFQKSWARKTIAAIRDRSVEPTVTDNPEIRAYMVSEAKRLKVDLPKDI